MERLTDRQTDRQICEMAATIIIKTRLKRLSVLTLFPMTSGKDVVT